MLKRIRNCKYIDEHICTSGQPSEEQLISIAEAGYQLIINLGLHTDPRYALKDERATVVALGLDYIHIPVKFDDPQEEDLVEFFEAIDKNAGRKLWIHCAANYRVSVFLGLYRVIKLGLNHDQAFNHVEDLWQPDATWSSFIERVLSAHRNG